MNTLSRPLTRRFVCAAGTALAIAPGRASAQAASYGQTHTLVMALPYALLSLDPAVAGTLRADLSVVASIYTSLTKVDNDGKLVGVLAKSWSRSADNVWVFDLRDDIKFANGAKLNAGVVKWNMDRVLGIKDASWIVASMRQIETVTALADDKVAFTLKAPDVEFPRRLAGIFFLEPEWAKTNNPAVSAMGSGPYKLVSFNPETGVFLEASDTYAGTPPAFRKVNMRVVVDTAARVNGLKAGEIDTAAVLDVQDLKQLEEDPNLIVGVKPTTRVQIIRFNTLIKPMDDVRVRKAINYAINKEAITKALFRGLVAPAASQILTTLHEGYNTDLKPWPYDPDKAKQLLAEAGYPNGFDVEMVYGKGTYVGAELAAQVVVGQLARVGIRAQLNIIPASLHAQRAASDQQAAMTWFGYADTATVASETLTYLGGTHNQTRGPVPAAYNAAVQAARSALTTEAEMAAVKTATRVAADEAMAVFLWDLPQTFAESKKVVWDIRRDDWTLPYDVRPA